MKEMSVFDVIGPNMIGPSSSHTAGALRIALMICGISAVLPAAPLFDMLEPDRSGNFEESEGFKG